VLGLLSGDALQIAFCIMLVNSAVAFSMSVAVLSGILSRKFSSIRILNASQFVWLLFSFGEL
jgi:hypothetical protein